MSQLTYAERQVYQALCAAADGGLSCPLNIDLEMLTGYSSSSMGPTLVANLERKGLIEVERYQRFRRVKICATGKWTARSETQRGTSPHVPRGMVSGSYPSGGRIAKKAREI